jgi:hypothetical protein
MAEFSKQWCEIWDPSMTHDFDIEAIAKDMYRDRYYPIICEGMGFRSIYKDHHGRVWLGYNVEGGNNPVWKPYKSVIAEQVQKAAKNESSSI